MPPPPPSLTPERHARVPKVSCQRCCTAPGPGHGAKECSESMIKDCPGVTPKTSTCVAGLGTHIWRGAEGVALPLPEGLEHGRGEAQAPAADAPLIRKEWIFRSQEEGNAAQRMCPKQALVKYDPPGMRTTGRRRWGVCQATGVTR